MDRMTERMEKKVAAPVKEATAHLSVPIAARERNGVRPVSPAAAQATTNARASNATLYPSYRYTDPNASARKRGCRDWDVPADFKFQTADLYSAWQAWLLGYPMNRSTRANGEVYLAPVKPLRLLRRGQLPAKVKKTYDNAWRPVLELMESEIEGTLLTTPVSKMDAKWMSAQYTYALKHVCAKYPDIKAELVGSWKISAWSRKIKDLNAKKRKAARISSSIGVSF
mmetsp:Transcript_16129/g.27509  ORF Transcript_16129/g.27509 Transcript_16129/m.27509 type:complete len:226 (-) Transcript_16129:39-716(-)